MQFDNKVYDRLKWMVTLLLPALGTLYFTLASIWGLPYCEQVVGTIMAVDALLGVLLGISSASYKGDGTLIITPCEFGGEEAAEIDFTIDTSIADIEKKKSVVLCVEKTDGKANIDE